MARRGGLGRGLDSLIPDRVSQRKQQKKAEEEKKQAEEEKRQAEDKSEHIPKKKTAEKKAQSEEGSGNEKNNRRPGEKQIEDGILSTAEPENVSFEKQESTIPENSGRVTTENKEVSESEKTSESQEKLQKQETTSELQKDLSGQRTHDEELLRNQSPKTVTKGTESPVSEKKDTSINQSLADKVIHLRISLVEPKRDQPRKYFDDQSIDELADSISQFGIISPLLVQKKDDYYEIIAGERRWRAAKKAGLKEVPVIIKNLSDREAVEISLIENIQREDLNPMEESRAYERLVKEYGLSQEEVAKKVSRSRSAVTNSMRLLKLQPSVQKMVENGSLSEGHARTIVSIEDPVLQNEVAEQVIESNLSVRQTEMLVKSLQKSDKIPHKQKRDPRRETLLQDLAEHLKNKLGTKVSIRPSGKNKGRIEIEYYSDEELDRIYELLQSVRQEG